MSPLSCEAVAALLCVGHDVVFCPRPLAWGLNARSHRQLLPSCLAQNCKIPRSRARRMLLPAPPPSQDCAWHGCRCLTRRATRPGEWWRGLGGLGGAERRGSNTLISPPARARTHPLHLTSPASVPVSPHHATGEPKRTTPRACTLIDWGLLYVRRPGVKRPPASACGTVCLAFPRCLPRYVCC